MDPGDAPYVCFQWLTPKQAMELANWNPQKKFWKLRISQLLNT